MKTRFKHIRQPMANVCGQTVVAMITGVSVDELIAEIGVRKTRLIDLERALNTRGWILEKSKIVLPGMPQQPAVFFGQVINQHRLFGHWALWTGTELLDPDDEDRTGYGPQWKGRFYVLKRKGQ